MSNEKRHTEDDREIRDTLNELNFITFCEAILKETETQEKFYQVEIEESLLYKLWQQREKFPMSNKQNWND